jgi:tetratricopeptide (TPR) repeat protein
MKITKIPWLLLLIIVLITSISVYEYFLLNRFSLDAVENVFAFSAKSQPYDINANSSSKNLNCHFKWLTFDPVINKETFDKNDKVVDELLNCSLLHVYFIRIFAPTDMELAQKASLIYPEDPGILYWLADGIEKNDPVQAEQLFRRIVELQPYNGRAWHRLGRLVEQRGLVSEAIFCYHNSCVNNDPGNHGCLNAGRLLEQEGRYEKAIYYYNLSRLASIRANADRLEIEIKNKSTN